jgi:hypothetical protein
MRRSIIAAIALMVVAILILAAIPLLSPKSSQRVQSGVVISEVLYDPFGEDPGKEWVELCNSGSKVEDIKGWKLSNRSATLCTLPSLSLRGGEYLLLCLGDVSLIDEEVAPTSQVYSAGLTTSVLNNQGDEIAISAGALGTNTIVDFVCWSDSPGYIKGSSYKTAVSAGEWRDGDLFDTGPTSGNSMVAGFTMARDRDQTDTNRSVDWSRNGGRDAYFATAGSVNAAPYFTAADGIKVLQAKANQFFLQWEYDVINASHLVSAQTEAWNSTVVIAQHAFTVDIGGVVVNFSGLGEYRWWRVSDTLWRDSISLALGSGASTSTLWLNYSRSYVDIGVVQTISEQTLCTDVSMDLLYPSADEPPLGADIRVPVEEIYASTCVTVVRQEALARYSVIVNDSRWLEYRGEMQWLNFSKDYRILSDTVIEAWTHLRESSDSRPAMSVDAHYTMSTDVGWHRVNDFGEMEVVYHAYNMSYGGQTYVKNGEGRYTIDRLDARSYAIDWLIPMVRTDGVPGNINVGGHGAMSILERGGEKVYSGDFTPFGHTEPYRYCIDGYESIVGGGICAIAGGLIGLIFVGVGSVIGAGAGATACGAAGYAIEEYCEDDTEKPEIEIEITGQGSNKYKGWVDIKVTVTDNEGLDKVTYGSSSSALNKKWSMTAKPGGKSYTFSRNMWTEKCTEDWRTITVKAWDKSGNMAVKSMQIRVPPRDCTPNIQETKPADKECSVPVRSNVVITFCKPMNTTSAESAIRAAPYFAYGTSWSADNSTLTMTPLAPLQAMTVYTILITTEAKSYAERPLPENYTFWFMTEDPYGPEIAVAYLPDTPVVHAPILMLDGSVSDNIGIILHGYSVSNSMGLFNFSFPMPPAPYIPFHWEAELAFGMNEVVVWAIDVYGNYAKVSRTVEFQHDAR